MSLKDGVKMESLKIQKASFYSELDGCEDTLQWTI